MGWIGAHLSEDGSGTEKVLDAILRRLRAATSQHLQDDLALLLIGSDPSGPPLPDPAPTAV